MLIDDDNAYNETPRIDERTSALFDKENNICDIIPFLSGSKWEVVYYNQIRGMNDTTNTLDLNIPSTVQRYNRYDNFIIHTETTITQDNLDNINGTGILSGHFVPALSDMFYAELTGGRRGLFTITDITTKSYQLNTVYNIDFKLFLFLETSPLMEIDLNRKTLSRYKIKGSNCIRQDVVQDNGIEDLDLQYEYSNLLDYYLTEFTNRKKMILSHNLSCCLPHDIFVTDFFFKVVDTVDSLKILKINRIDDTKIILKKPITIYDVILQNNYNLLRRAKRNIAYREINLKMNIPSLNRYSYLGLTHVSDIIEDCVGYVINDVPLGSVLNSVESVDLTYVVSNYFYDRTALLDPLESVLDLYIKNTTIGIKNIISILNDYPNWEKDKQYKMIPVVLLILKKGKII